MRTSETVFRKYVVAEARPVVPAVLLGALALLLGLAGTAQSPRSPQSDTAHPAQAQNWVDTRLYFGLGPADFPHKGVSEAVWRAFLDREVTPLFPAGLSVLDVYGQWQSKPTKGTVPHPERIRSKLLIIDYPNTPENAARIEAIRAAWKRQTGDQSVLKVTQPADISF